MATQLTIINNVLRRLREDTVSTPSETSYSTLIAMWINDGIRDITDRYQWESLKHEITIDLVASQVQYDLATLVSGGGAVYNAGRVTTEHSMLEWDRSAGKPMAYLFDTSTDTGYNAQMRLISEEDRNRLYQGDRDSTVTEPTDFSLVLNPEGTGYDLNVYPAPTAARTVRLTFWTPQAELATAADTDSSTDIILNAAVVEAYVHMIASNERGEEMGEPGNVLERRFINLLGAAMEVPIRQEERENRYESRRD